MKVELLSITDNPELLIVKAGRTCYKSDKEDTKETIEKFIKTVIKNGHESVLEHASASFRVSEVSRALTHQLVRHRIGFSYSQESQRYVKQDQFDYVIPDSIRGDKYMIRAYNELMIKIQEDYRYFIGNGVRPEDARMILPNACHTEIVMTANFREWRHVIKMRAEKDAQWEIRDMIKEIGKILLEDSPSIFCDLEELIYAE